MSEDRLVYEFTLRKADIPQRRPFHRRDVVFSFKRAKGHNSKKR